MLKFEYFTILLMVVYILLAQASTGFLVFLLLFALPMIVIFLIIAISYDKCKNFKK